MKRYLSIVFIMAMVILSGCGAVDLGQNQSNATGTIMLIIKPNGSMQSSNVTSQLMPIEATNVRVRIFNSSGANIVEDVAVPTDGTPVSLTVNLPVGTYSIHAYSYKKTSNSNGIALTGGSTDGIVIESGQNSQATLHLSKWQLSFTVPTEPIVGGTTYNINLTLDNHTEFTYGPFYLVTSQTPWTDNPSTGSMDSKYLSNSQVQYSQTAPCVSQQTILYYQVYCYLDCRKYWRTELPCMFTYVFFPSTTAGQSLGELSILPPGGSVEIGFE